MILVDTSIFVQYLRSPTPEVREVLGSGDCGVCGVVRAELLHGARTEQDLGRLNSMLDAFPQVPTPESVCSRLGEHLSILRARGLPMPFQDVLLATLAIVHDADLWSDDAHFRSMQAVLPQLRVR